VFTEIGPVEIEVPRDMILVLRSAVEAQTF
jgi:hypothetical protein